MRRSMRKRCTRSSATSSAGRASRRRASSTSRWRRRSTPVPDIRIDPLSGHKVVVAAERATRPGAQFSAQAPPPIDPATDPFAEGNEDRTPPEVWANRPGGGPADSPGWIVRAVPTLSPAVSPDAGAPEPDARPDLFGAQPAAGAHEVIVNGPQAVGALAELPV